MIINMKTIIITNEQQKKYAQNLIAEMPVDSSMTVITKKTSMDSTAKQRRLQWMWYTEVAAAGLGRNDTKEGVHTTAKWVFARPILLRDDKTFGAVYAGFEIVVNSEENRSRADMWREFTQYFISTESLSRRQRAEYLTEFQRYWTGKGVELTRPEDQGLDEYLGFKPKVEA